MKTRLCAIVLTVLLAASLAGAEEIEGLPVHLQKIDDSVIRVWLGDHISSTAIMAFSTEKGIVVVDTWGVPKVDVQLREAIARELGRSDFAFLINTHEHRDHTGGNSVYSDCTIVGHELIAAGMAEAATHRDQMLEYYPTRIADLETALEELDPDDPMVASLSEDLILVRLLYEQMLADQQPVPPTLTFSDRMSLDLGDTTFELSYIGGMHTASDAAVLVPEHGLLLTGDTMADVWLTDTPGCLASFSVRDGMAHDFPLWLANWDRLLARRDEIDTLLPAHWNGELSIEGAEARVEYVRTLWDGINEASQEGKNVGDVMVEYRLDARFPDLVGKPGFHVQQHYGSLAELWREVTGQASAARTVWTMLGEGAEEAAVVEVVAARDADSSEYFFLETEFNAYGYIFLQQGRVDEALTMFKINAELYPDSWNAYDSLGEALLAADKVDEAVKMYEKSLALNPDNTNGTEVLTRIRKAASM
jgi:glyoxylase-like metal-dependent hydrolase (beta-lactamase superfamily II)